MSKTNLVYFVIASVFLVFLAIDWRMALAVFSAWLLLSISIIAVAYLFNIPMIFRKKTNGSIPWTSRWLFLPVLVSVQLFNAYKRLTDTQPPMQLLLPHLFIGCRLVPSDLERLSLERIDAVLDLTAEFDGLGSFADYDSSVDYLNIPILDHGVPKHRQILQACEWIDQHRQQQHSVLVHCALGRGRALFICAAYLIYSNVFDTAKAALNSVTSNRPKASLNRRQYRALLAWAASDESASHGHSRIALIANPKAGSGQWSKVKQEILGYLKPIFSVSIYEADDQTDLHTCTQQALLNQPDMVVACGGDGTLRTVVQAVVDQSYETKIGLIPLGTANAFASTMFGLKGKLFPIHEACNTIIDSKTRRIDIAECNDEVSLLLTGVGVEAAMTQWAEADKKQILGPLSYTEGFIRALHSQATLSLSVWFDGQLTPKLETKSLVIANAAPATSLLAQGNSEPVVDDGKLNVTWIQEQALYSMPEAVGALALSGLTEVEPIDAVQHRHCRTLRVEATNQQALEYVIDGESRCAQQLSIRVLPARIDFLCPNTVD